MLPLSLNDKKRKYVAAIQKWKISIFISIHSRDNIKVLKLGKYFRFVTEWVVSSLSQSIV
ncbi:uncharacterized protein PRCAT00004327001 [Priceomyces carsonii]|uniref:uncharacterized protein n=1 Tax=Priceomyces carsonii TaxID=28549 RepID=UPI002EDB469B|nr:unnamed protein product [Priceomyces carsonii]